MGRRRGKSLKAFKKRHAATAATNAAEADGDGTTAASAATSTDAFSQKRQRERDDVQKGRDEEKSVRDALKISNRKKRQRVGRAGVDLKPVSSVTRISISEAVRLQRDKGKGKAFWGKTAAAASGGVAEEEEEEEEEEEKKKKKKKREQVAAAAASVDTPGKGQKRQEGKKRGDDFSREEVGRYVGLDCEMVGVGVGGKRSVLARACVVDWSGAVLYDAFVKVNDRVTDFRTKYSGVRARHLKSDATVSFDECTAIIAALLKGKILVGHALRNDLKVLLLSHPHTAIRDTARYRPLMRHGRDGKFQPRKLRDLAKEHLAMDIQGGEHSPDEDARAAMLLYRRYSREWEGHLRSACGVKIKRPEQPRLASCR
jgi:RNA exonuclease 4